MKQSQKLKYQYYQKAKTCAEQAHQRAKRHGVESKNLRLFIQDKLEHTHKCYHCGKILYYPEEKTIDHKLAMALGGPNLESNIVISCNECNNIKAAIESREVIAMRWFKSFKAVAVTSN